MPFTASLQRGLLFALIACITLCGLAGIYVLVGGKMGPFEGRVLGTTALMAVACLLGWAAAIPLARDRWRPVAIVAWLAILAAVAAWLIEIWELLGQRVFGVSRLMEKWLISTSVVAALATHVALLGLAKVRTWYEWVRLGTAAASILLALAVLAQVWLEIRDDDIWRLYGVLIILGVCGSITVIILHRISSIRTKDTLVTAPGLLSLTCPRCALAQQLPAGRSRCTRCGLRFSIEILEDQCRTCGYPLYQLESTVCPECGTPFTRDALPSGPLESSNS